MEKIFLNIFYTIMNEKYSDGVDLMQQLWGEAWDPEHVENDANDSAPRDVISQGAEE